MLDAAESNALLAVSPTCSVVDFWEPDCNEVDRRVKG